MPKAKVEKPVKVQEEKEIAPVATELVPEKTTGIVAPIVSPQEALANWKAFQDLKKSLLDGSDYQPLMLNGQKKSFTKKSGWRKLATAFNISDEVIKEERKDYEGYFVIEITAKAIAMNGRFATGIGSCASNERGFAHLEHDVRSTAHTRAKNRAISDLIGGGEVSYEEMEGVEGVKPVIPQKPTPKVEGKCPVDHNTLPWKVVQKEGKTKGKLFKTCPTCRMFQWKPETEEVKE